jgi:hypothetical protein
MWVMWDLGGQVVIIDPSELIGFTGGMDFGALDDLE